MADESLVRVEVACATAESQRLLTLNVTPGTTLRQAVLISGIERDFPSIDMGEAPLGLYGRRIDNANERAVSDGDRIEVYRPLLADPKEARKRRAARSAATAGQKDCNA